MKDSIMSQYFGESVTEIKGRPGIIWGNLVVPASGRSRITIKLMGNLLQCKIKLAYGLENKEIHTRLQDIGSIEIAEGRLWWLFWLGISTVWFYGFGLIFLIPFFLIKQHWIVFYTNTVNLILIL